ncbi:DUF1062 domain-containing protein [Ochrobactrum vermis]|uniref:DUF1062 domain-containing protein n=1 Tax=Ochrobactrum vermis TaxID=1827297 RepID=A0ABU8PA84_9HYPH|nr:DUF1062 domain-containing protein [Ochrobactrum vermis]PQZ31134.1 hypothetical protein CQZ93_01040 [Ochrobactrum vermis]
MSDTLRVRWIITPKIAPQPWIACGGCSKLKAFQSSGKVRLNANGRKLDAWLIYKCLTCDKTWNRPIFERQNVREIDPKILEALQSNDPQWIRREAFDIQALRRKSQRVDEFSECEVVKGIAHGTANSKLIEIELQVALTASIRLDRLLATELQISRASLQALCDRRVIRIAPDENSILRRRVKTGVVISINPGGLDRETGWQALVAGRALERRSD